MWYVLPYKETNHYEISIEKAGLMVSNTNISEEIHHILYDPLIRSNFNSMLKIILSQDSSTWVSIAFDRQYKKSMHGFDFKVRLDNNRIPNGIMYMTPMMQSNLLRFGDFIFYMLKRKVTILTIGHTLVQ